MKPPTVTQSRQWPWVVFAFLFAVLAMEDLIEKRWRLALISFFLWLMSLLAYKVVGFMNNIIAVSRPVSRDYLDDASMHHPPFEDQSES